MASEYATGSIWRREMPDIVVGRLFPWGGRVRRNVRPGMIACSGRTIMRKLIFPVLFWLPAVVGAGMAVYGAFTSDMGWVDRGVDWAQSGGIIYVMVAAKRLLTNWPAGILFSSGFEAGVQWQKKHARRGRFQVVREPPRQSRG